MASLVNTSTDELAEFMGFDSTACTHYSRKCLIVAPCCNEIFPCRICHDTKHVDDWRLDPEDQHAIDRRAITEIICVACQTRQLASNECSTCAISFAAYYCSVCHLWDDAGDTKGIYHCDGCGICRVGGQQNFIHCNVCNMCIGVTNTDHACRAGDQGNCPICMESISTSRKPAMWMPCG